MSRRAFGVAQVACVCRGRSKEVVRTLGNAVGGDGQPVTDTWKEEEVEMREAHQQKVVMSERRTEWRGRGCQPGHSTQTGTNSVVAVIDLRECSFRVGWSDIERAVSFPAGRQGKEEDMGVGSGLKSR